VKIHFLITWRKAREWNVNKKRKTISDANVGRGGGRGQLCEMAEGEDSKPFSRTVEKEAASKQKELSSGGEIKKRKTADSKWTQTKKSGGGEGGFRV